MLRLSDFNYYLPKNLIAQYPLKERDLARLLVLNRKKQTIEHRVFKDIINYLNPNELLVLNNTKVLPCRLRGNRLTGGKAEVLLLKRKIGSTFDSLIKPGRLKIGEKIIFNHGRVSGIISAKSEISFDVKNIDSVYSLGVMPLPPYIKREPRDSDKIFYQTVYAKKKGAVASPTAGLHFTRELIAKIKSQGVNIAYLTLHVGSATFKPVKVDDIRKHKMQPEYFEIPAQTAKLIERIKRAKDRIISVGTTSCRAVETYASGIKKGKTDLFIYPGYKFKLTDCLLTNFHLPATTLFMLVCAFAGEKLIKKAYQEAIERNYRFYSYGDAMFII